MSRRAAALKSKWPDGTGRNHPGPRDDAGPDRKGVDAEPPRTAGFDGAAGAVTLSSPLEELGLSMRSRNALRKLGCDTVRSVVEKDFRRATRQFGPVSRREVADALMRSGFAPPETLEPRRADTEVLERDVSRLRQRIESSYRFWLEQVARIEERLRHLRGGAG